MSGDAQSGAGVTLPDGRAPETARGGTPVPDHVLRAIYGDTLGEKVSDAPGEGKKKAPGVAEDADTGGKPTLAPPPGRRREATE